MERLLDGSGAFYLTMAGLVLFILAVFFAGRSSNYWWPAGKRVGRHPRANRDSSAPR